MNYKTREQIYKYHIQKYFHWIDKTGKATPRLWDRFCYFVADKHISKALDYERQR